MSATALACTLILILTTLFVGYAFHVLARWKLRHIPGPLPKYIVGNMRDYPAGKLSRGLINWPRKYGPVLKYFVGHEVFLLVSDPKLVQEVAVKQFSKFHDRKPLPMWVSVSPEDDERMKWEILWSKGKFWSTIRAACDPLFHSKSLSSYAPLIHSSAETMLDDVGKMEAGPVEIMKPLEQLSLQIIGTAAFGVDFGCQGKEVSNLARSAKFVLKPPPEKGWFNYLILTCPPLRPFLSWLITKYGMRMVGFQRLVRCAGFLVGASKALLHNSRISEQGGKPGSDPILLPPSRKVDLPPGLRAQKEAQAAGAKEFQAAVPAPNSFFSKLLHTTHREAGQDAKPLTDLQIMAQGTPIIIAGYDTTSLALTATLFELAKDQTAQERLKQEADAWYASHESQPSYGDLEQFPYTQAAFMEALRMHPAVSPHLVQVRVALEDVNLGGYRVPKGTPVVMNTLGIHYDDRLFPNPETFRPERFLEGSPDGPETRSPYAYLAFGAGPHRCIGGKLAIAEGVFVLVNLHRRYSYTLDAEHHTAGSGLETNMGVTLRPEKGVWLQLKPRQFA